MMTAALLAEVGAALYGPQWKAPLAATLEVSVRIVANWSTGKTPMPDTLARELAVVLLDRERLLRDVGRRVMPRIGA